ncbi:MAG: hypothetical protein R3A51_08905 [Nannocystaceae bacterium]|nr:hypothetical protein [Myxococcales bacterium]
MRSSSPDQRARTNHRPARLWPLVALAVACSGTHGGNNDPHLRVEAESGCVAPLGPGGSLGALHFPQGHPRCTPPQKTPKQRPSSGEPDSVDFDGTSEAQEPVLDPLAQLDDSYGVLGP